MADIEVSAAALTQHASEIDTYMTALREAAASGDQSFDLRAFGLIGSTWSSGAAAVVLGREEPRRRLGRFWAADRVGDARDGRVLHDAGLLVGARRSANCTRSWARNDRRIR